jgi:hypothetical protein
MVCSLISEPISPDGRRFVIRDTVPNDRFLVWIDARQGQFCLRAHPLEGETDDIREEFEGVTYPAWSGPHKSKSAILSDLKAMHANVCNWIATNAPDMPAMLNMSSTLNLL